MSLSSVLTLPLRRRFSASRLPSLRKDGAGVRKTLRGLIPAILLCLGLRAILIPIFPGYVDCIDYSAEALATALAAYSQWIVFPRQGSPSLRLRWTLWIVYLVIRAHLVGIAALGSGLPHFLSLRTYQLSANSIGYTAFLFALTIPSFSKGSRIVRAIEIFLGALLAGTLLIARFEFQEGGSQTHYLLFIFCYQLFIAISAQFAIRASSSIPEYNCCRRIAGYSLALILVSSLVNFRSLHPGLPYGGTLDGFTGLENLVLVWLTSRGFVRPSRRLVRESMYAAKSWLPFLMTLAIVTLSIYLIPNRTAFAVAALLLAIMGYAWRNSTLLSEQLRAQHESARDQTSLRRLVYIDPLTGAGNRRSFEQHLEEERLHQLNTGDAFSLLLFDIDKFKHLNDSFGHPFGDTCLRLLVDVVQSVAIRSSDHLARLGGDEFALILTRTKQDGAKSLAQRIEQDLAQATATLDAPFTISIGMATSEPSSETGSETGSESGEPLSVEALIAAADQALYQAKKAKSRSTTVVEQGTSE